MKGWTNRLTCTCFIVTGYKGFIVSSWYSSLLLNIFIEYSTYIHKMVTQTRRARTKLKDANGGALPLKVKYIKRR